MQFARHRLDPDADERRERASAQSLRDFLRRSLRVAIFLCVGSVAVAVLEIDAEVFDRLASKLLYDTCPNRTRKLRRLEAQGPCKRRGVWRILVEHTARSDAELSCRVRAEQMRAAVNGVDRLTIVCFARECGCDRGICLFQ